MGVYLPAEFQIYSIIVTNFRQGGGDGNLTPNPTPHYPLPQNELLKSPPRLGLKSKSNMY